MDRSEQFKYASFVKRLIAMLVNIAVNVIAIIGSVYVLKYCFEYQAVLPQFGYFIIWLAIYTYMLVSGGVTPGGALLGIRIVGKEGRYLSISQAFFRNFVFFLTLLLHSAMLWRTLGQMPISFSPANWQEILIAYKDYSPFLFQLIIGIQLFTVFDLLSILFNGQNRALKDLMADSFVIERKNYQRITVNRTRTSGFRQKTKAEKEMAQEKEMLFHALNQVMEVPEVMRLVRKDKEIADKHVSVKFISTPKNGNNYYQFLVKENNEGVFNARVIMEHAEKKKSKILFMNEQEEWITLSQWRRRKIASRVKGNISLAKAS